MSKKIQRRQLLVISIFLLFVIFCLAFPHLMVAACLIVGFIFFVVSIPGLTKTGVKKTVDVTKQVYDTFKQKDSRHE